MERLTWNEKELAKELGICQRGVANLRKNGYLKAVKLGRVWVYPKKEVEKFFERYLGKELSTK